MGSKTRTVRCSDCGYLEEAKNPSVAHPDTQWIAANPASRRTPPNRVRCYVQESTFSELSPIDDRKCDQFVKWTPGLSPSEHAMLQEMGKRQRIRSIIALSGIAVVIIIGLINLLVQLGA